MELAGEGAEEASSLGNGKRERREVQRLQVGDARGADLFDQE